jgi:uncharacterized protein
MLFKRKLLEKLIKISEKEGYIILTGARQTGKTSIMLLFKENLENKKEKCFYLNLENPEYLSLLNEHPFKIFELLPDLPDKLFVFIDEIQYLNDPSNFLKLLYDEKRKKIRIIASGSSSFYIDKKFKDSLAGRKYLFEVYPLDFEEYLEFKAAGRLIKKRSGLKIIEKKEISNFWEEYIRFGGYPKVALAENEEMKKIELEEIGTSYIKKDIADAGIRNNDKYFALLKILASQTGSLVNAEELSNTLGIARKTVDEYLYVIRKSYQAAFVAPFYRNMRKELTKMPKVYFFDLGLRNFFLGGFNRLEKRHDKGSYLENTVFLELLRQSGGNADKVKFWRTQDGKEVDFIKAEKSAYEVKFSLDKKNERKYSVFKEEYPDIKFKIITEKDVLREFYGFDV